MGEIRLGVAGAGIAAPQVLPNLKDLAGRVTLLKAPAPPKRALAAVTVS